MKDSFILYTKYGKQIQGLTMEQRGVLFTAILMHESGEPLPEMDACTQMAYSFICVDLDENRQKYEDKCEQNKLNGANGGRPRKTEENQTVTKKTEKTERFSEKRPQAKKADNDNEYDNDNDLKEKDTLKSIKKEKPGKPDSPPLMVAVRQIVDHLNEKAGTKYMASSRATVEMIKARLNERWTVEDHIKVIDNMTAAWKGDPKMEEYIRPSTLFARAHFEEYLNRKPTARTGANRFQNFPARQDQQHKDMVAQIIAMNAGGRT